MSAQQEGLQPVVWYVILNWNQPQMTADCLDSLAQQSYHSFRVLVVDNGSKDGSAALLRERFAWATILELPENIGYSAANNVGIDYAMRQAADYVLLLNNDTIVDPLMLETLLRAIEADPNVGVASPKMLFFDQPEVIWSAGAQIDWGSGRTFSLRQGEVDRGLDGEPEKVSFVSGCAMCIRRQAIEETGALDPRFFIYYEETDWCARAGAAGWKILYVPQARLWHRVSAAMGATSPATDYYMTRNRILFCQRHLRSWRLWLALARLCAGEVRTIAAYSLKARHKSLHVNRDARVLALRDACLGRWGRMGPDVETVCYRWSH
jgi:GT2 family glycosyltransferase